MTYDEFLSAAVVLLGPIEDKYILRRAIRQAAGQQLGPTLWLQKGREAYEEITHGST